MTNTRLLRIIISGIFAIPVLLTALSLVTATFCLFFPAAIGYLIARFSMSAVDLDSTETSSEEVVCMTGAAGSFVLGLILTGYWIPVAIRVASAIPIVLKGWFMILMAAGGGT